MGERPTDLASSLWDTKRYHTCFENDVRNTVEFFIESGNFIVPPQTPSTDLYEDLYLYL